MVDYFSAVGTTPTNQSMLARFCISGDAKLWWKQWCKDMGVTQGFQTWENVKSAFKGRYFPPTHESIKMNEFFALFITLRIYAVALTNEQQIARFYESLNKPLGTTLEAMKPISLQDALEQAKSLSKGIAYTPAKRIFLGNQGPSLKHQLAYPTLASYRPRVYLSNTARPHPGLCYECKEMGYFWKECPRSNRGEGPQAQHGRGRANGARGGCGGRNKNVGRNENGGRNENVGRNKNGGQGRGCEANGRVNVVYA